MGGDREWQRRRKRKKKTKRKTVGGLEKAFTMAVSALN